MSSENSTTITLQGIPLNTPPIIEAATTMPPESVLPGRNEVLPTTDLEMALADFRQAGDKVMARVAEVQSERNTLIEERDALAETVNSQRYELSQSQAKINEFEGTVKQLQQHIHELQEEKQKLQEENQQMQSDHKSMFANIMSLKNGLDKNINILMKAKNDSDAEIASLTAKNKQLVKTFHALQSERNKYEIQVNILTKVNQVSEEKISSLKAKLDNLDTINERTSISSSTLPLPEEIECSGNQEPPGTLSNPFTLDDSDVENDDGNLEFKPLAPLHTNEKPRKKKRASMVRQLDSCLESPKKLRSHSARWRRGRMER